MHQKNNAGASAQSAQIEGDDEDGDGELRLTREPDNILRNPFEDDAEDVDEDSDDGLGGDENSSWNSHARGSWWRSALSRNRKEKFGDGRDDSDSDQDEQGDGDEDEDEEFGDFAMPEKENDGEKSNVIVKPLPVHPPTQNQKSSGFTSLWPFSGQGFGSRDKDKSKEGETEKTDQDELTSDDGGKIKSTHEATARSSIEDPDEEEVVV
jgi:SIT4-associating protein SAP185/190